MRRARLTGAGTALLMTLFFVLCLTVLCALTLSSSMEEHRLAHAYAAAQRDYYDADEKAVRVLAALLEADDAEDARVAFESVNGGRVARYLCEAGARQALFAEVFLGDNGSYEVLAWKLVSTVEHSIDERLNVWQGG